MKRSQVFWLVLVVAILSLSAVLLLAVLSSGSISGGRQAAVTVSGNSAMLVGSDDTLYLFSDGVTKVLADGSIDWKWKAPDGWTVLKSVELTSSHGPNASMSCYEGETVAADEQAGYVYLCIYHFKSVSNFSDYVYDLPDDVPLVTDIPSKVIAIAPDGTTAWEYSFTANGTCYVMGTAEPMYSPRDRLTLQVSGDRVYVFHDHREDVLGLNGTLLFSISDVAEPASIDEVGNLYIVHAYNPHIHVNGTIDDPDWLALSPVGNDPQYYYENIERLAYDPTYMARSSIVEAYSPAGVLLWSTDVNETIAGTYDDLTGTNPVFRGLPLYANRTLYVPVVNGTVALGTDGSIKWVRHLSGLDTFEPFSVLPVDDAGNVYEASINNSGDIVNWVTSVFQIAPDGYVTATWSYPTASTPQPVMRSDGVVHMFSDGAPVIRISEEFSEAVENFDPETLIAYDIRNNRTLWTFTIPHEDIHVVTLNESNIERIWQGRVVGDSIGNASLASGSYAGEVQETYEGWPVDSISLYADRYASISIVEGKNFAFLSYYNRIYESPLIYNRSRCAYVSEIYALDLNGSLIWKTPADGTITKMVAGNNTVYYDLTDRGLGSKTFGTVAAGVALSALVYLFFRFFMIGTVARARSRLDDNENRNRVLRYVVDHPGVTAVDVARETGMNMGTIRYHLFILTLNHKVATHRDDGKFLRYFRNAGAYTEAEKELLSFLRRKPMRRILFALVENPGMSGPELARELGISTTAVNRHVGELAGKGIVERQPGAERGYAYTISAERLSSVEKLLDATASHARASARPATADSQSFEN